MEAERIILTPVDGSDVWRAEAEGGDVEPPTAKFSIEQAGERDGEPVYRITADGEDVQGHGWNRGYSDLSLKQDVTQIKRSLEALDAIERGSPQRRGTSRSES